MRITGHYQRLGVTEYFIPDTLPPQNPPLDLDPALLTLYGDAMHELGNLKEMTYKLPDVERFLKAYVIKEAVLSASIEGINTTLLDVFTQPLLETKPSKETQLVLNYTQALYESVLMIKSGLPISSRVIKKAHELLMQSGSDNSYDLGNYRKQSVKVGNLIPPPAQHIPKLMTELEQYINSDTELPVLINAGLVHVQFETIHPFLDGNGRIGRLLIVLMLVEKNLLVEPLLYSSYYFKKHHLEYYQKLDSVRTNGDFEGWLSYYLTAMKESSRDAYRRTQAIEILENTLTQLIKDQKHTTSKAETRLQALSVFFRYPVISASELRKQLSISYNTAHQIITEFTDLRILIQETAQRRNKLFSFTQYLDILEKQFE